MEEATVCSERKSYLLISIEDSLTTHPAFQDRLIQYGSNSESGRRQGDKAKFFPRVTGRKNEATWMRLAFHILGEWSFSSREE